MKPRRVIIIGGVAGGASFAARLHGLQTLPANRLLASDVSLEGHQ